MPQEFHVVRCYACQIFQVQQVKKVAKWVCKMCGEKQSLKKEYGRGSGADCRRHVQKLNMMAGESGSEGHGVPDSFQERGHDFTPSFLNDDSHIGAKLESCFENSEQPTTSVSRWQAFVADDNDNTDEIPTQEVDSLPQLGCAEITLSRPVHQGRGGRKYGGWKSGRKRKRGDVDQDFDDDTTTATHQNKKFPASKFHPYRSNFSDNVETSDFNDEGKSFSSLPKSVVHPKKTARQLSNLGQAYRVQALENNNGISEPRSSWNDDADDRLERGVPKKQRPAETGCSVSSKWGNFLQDSDEDIKDESEDIIANRGPAESGCHSKWGQFLQDSEEKCDGSEDMIDNRGPAESGCSAGSKWGQFIQDSVDNNGESEDMIDNRGPAESGCHSKWGQFLQDSEDIPDQHEDMVDNRGHVGKDTPQATAQFYKRDILHEIKSTVNQIYPSEDMTDNRGHSSKPLTVPPSLSRNNPQIEDTHTSQSEIQSNGFLKSRQSAVAPMPPIPCHKTLAGGHKFAGTKTQDSEEKAQTCENRSCFQANVESFFSLEEEGLLDEALQEDW